ncbi:BT1-like protein [Aureococcus anophagefferens]|nr:BT1-like protein [Aureococcus anophagefferens]
MDSNDALMQQDVTDAAQEEPDAAPDTPRSDHSLSIDPPSDPEPQPWRAPWTQLRCFYGRLGGAFGWRYVATVSLTYGVNQGVGEALLFGAQKPDVLGARGCFGLMTLTSLAVLLPAAAGWLGERRDDGAAGARAAPPELDAQRSAVFRCAGATCATSLAIGNLQAFYRRDDADAVVGSLTVGLGLCLSLFIFRGLKTISRDLASAAVFIFLSGALSPATEVMFAWFHDDEKDDGNCAKRCAEGDEDCGWARDRGYPCIGSVYYGYMRATGRVFGLVGIILYNKYLSRWPYRRVFALGYLVTFLANLLDLVWVTRTNLALGLDDEFFLLGLEVVQPVVSRLASMPMFVLAAKLCPANVEATLFALLMGLSNFGSVVGIYNGVALLHLFGGVDAPEFPRLSAFVATRTLCYLAPFALVFVLVPAGGPDDDADDDDGPAALELVGTDSAEERALVSRWVSLRRMAAR